MSEMRPHIHIVEGDDILGTLWVGDDGHVHDDGSFASIDMVRHHSKQGIGRTHGQKLLNEIVKTLDRASYVNAIHCSGEHCQPGSDKFISR